MRLRFTTLSIGLLTLGVLTLPGCGGQAATAAGAAANRARYRIVCTVGMVADIVTQVVGDRGEVTALMGAGVDPHLYKPTRNDIAALQSADIVFYSGLLLEGRMTDTLVRIASGGKHVFAVTERIDERYLLESPGKPGHHDPHVWMDVSAWSRCVEAIAAAMGTVDPGNAAEYQQRAEAYRAQLADLDAYIRRIIGSIPERQRALITAHDAFHYFGRAYDIRVLGVQGISTESEPGLEDVNQLVNFIVENGVQAVFVETSVSDKNVRALVEGAAARGHDVRIGGMLFSDAMGAGGTYEGTYIGMLDHNATTIARALGGDAPQRGVSGALAEPEGSP